MDIRRKCVVEKTRYPLDEVYNYNAQVWVSVDGGKSYCYCGIGKFCKTKEEAERYCSEYERGQIER